MEESNIKNFLKVGNWLRGQFAAKTHFKQYGLYFLDNPKTQFGEAFNETMMCLNNDWYAEDM